MSFVGVARPKPKRESFRKRLVFFASGHILRYRFLNQLTYYDRKTNGHLCTHYLLIPSLIA